jgi:hypothetical protein
MAAFTATFLRLPHVRTVVAAKHLPAAADALTVFNFAVTPRMRTFLVSHSSPLAVIVSKRQAAFDDREARTKRHLCTIIALVWTFCYKKLIKIE